VPQLRLTPCVWVERIGMRHLVESAWATGLLVEALLDRGADGDEAAYRDYRDRYRDMARSLGFEGQPGPRRCHDGGCSFGGRDVSFHRY
jgi:hypothetical protein